MVLTSIMLSQRRFSRLAMVGLYLVSLVNISIIMLRMARLPSGSFRVQSGPIFAAPCLRTLNTRFFLPRSFPRNCLWDNNLNFGLARIFQSSLSGFQASKALRSSGQEAHSEEGIATNTAHVIYIGQDKLHSGSCISFVPLRQVPSQHHLSLSPINPRNEYTLSLILANLSFWECALQ